MSQASFSNNSTLDETTLGNWLWDAACKIRGEIDAAKYRDYILPLIFLKRLSDVFEDELTRLIYEYGESEIVEALILEDHNLVRFYLPVDARWETITKKKKDVGQYLTDIVRKLARENPKLSGAIDIVDFNATTSGERIISDDSLIVLVGVLSKYRLGINDVQADIIGRAYEYLLRKFAEGSGSSAGEFFTPPEVARLMGCILDPEPGETVYDPCCGSGGLLIKCALRFRDKYSEQSSTAPLKYYGQEWLALTSAMAKMNVFLHNMEAEIAIGDSMNNPKFLSRKGKLQHFDMVTSNPMWNQKFDQRVYENDEFSRYFSGYPNNSSADWGWVQHMAAYLTDSGRMAVVLDTGAVSRGSGSGGSNRERDIRKAYVEQDLIESVILLPENLFFNTTAPGIILIVNKQKRHPREILLINGSGQFEKGRPKNFLTADAIKTMGEIYLQWKAVDEISIIITTSEAAKSDYNLSPSRYIAKAAVDDTIPLEDAVFLLKEAEEERALADQRLWEVLAELGLGDEPVSPLLSSSPPMAVAEKKQPYGKGKKS
ncbi:type I restriction-modification system subunit M [Methanospirillum purgamenti]|jgi:type I restriction enzyme M protein|uniref:site-specific DNA-methyltransferase (adenine-specific) n=1 Tax=Methanospirillum hungatei TaxID=2203 RepID=A0A8F5VQD0_METHU|nr:type I restriction-modification system subunit M [Methanospirillum hungatei]QXO95902.1 type I restriction-modification system subunit M [Methanospirillum hungatei]